MVSERFRLGRMTVQVSSPTGILMEGNADSIKFCGDDGWYQILNNHTPMMSVIVSKPVIVDKTVIPCSGGIINFSKNHADIAIEQLNT